MLGSTLDDVYAAVDAALGRVVAALPDGTDLHGRLAGRHGREHQPGRPAPRDAAGDPRPRRRAPDAGRRRARSGGCGPPLPSGLRAKVAGALPERVALDLTARLELRGVDWSRTRAFAHPAENQGYIRLNLRGRERDGIVDPADADALMDEIADGLRTFTDLDGSPGRASRSTGSPTGSARATAPTSCPT